MKVKLQLNAVVAVKENIETLINEYENTIIKQNKQMNVDALMNTLLMLQDQLIVVKEAIQNANKSKNSDGKSNNYFIYKKSNLEKHRKFLTKLSRSIGKDDHLACFNKDFINEKKKSLESEIKEIQTKLTKFNNSKKVSVEFNNSLVSLFPLVEEITKKK